jgi:hypothetical protein
MNEERRSKRIEESKRTIPSRWMRRGGQRESKRVKGQFHHDE